jgi:hypothetical protein
VVTWASDKNTVRFSSATLYEVYDQFGNIVKRGFASEIDVKDLKKGLYYLNYDNKMGNRSRSERYPRHVESPASAGLSYVRATATGP